MKYSLIFLSFIGLFACKTKAPISSTPKSEVKTIKKSDFTIAFGSGNNQAVVNPFWDDILTHKPDVWIWGGDNIYCDTEHMDTLAKCYQTQLRKPDYQNFTKKTQVIGVWDDHDYGVNDGGAEYPKKVASQDLFLDFLDVLCLDPRRKQKGTYHSINYQLQNHSIKIILLDTRYFRSALTKDENPKKRYKPSTNKQDSMLGAAQWEWLQNELSNSEADYNVIVSSIQFLSNQHGYEAWGNFPHEVTKMENLIVKSKAKGVIILSGDRHISEVSTKEIGRKKYKLIDFTSSGLTHSYTGFTNEPNPYRVSDVIHQKSYGLVIFDLKNNTISFEMWGEKNTLLQRYTK